MEDDVGSALTGQRTDPATAGAKWDDFMQRPGNRQALLQIGLQMMQPVGIGQTAGGHIAQSIGAGGEAVDRGSGLDLRERVAEGRLQTAQEQLQISRQRADSDELRATSAAARSTGKQVGGLTDIFRARAARDDAKTWEKDIKDEAESIVKQRDALMSPNAKYKTQYGDKSVEEVASELRRTRQRPSSGYTPDAAVGDVPNDTQQAGPPKGFLPYSDGVHRMDDPKNKGRMLEWRP